MINNTKNAKLSALNGLAKNNKNVIKQNAPFTGAFVVLVKVSIFYNCN